MKIMLLLGLILSISCDRRTPEEFSPILRFTAIPDDNTTELKQKFGPFAEYLSLELGSKWNICRPQATPPQWKPLKMVTST